MLTRLTDDFLNFSGFLGRFAIYGADRLTGQVNFAGRLTLISLGTNITQRRLICSLTLREVYKVVFSCLPLLLLINFLVGYLWAVVWYGQLANIGGLSTLVTLLLNIQVVIVSPIVLAIVAIIRYGAPMALEVAMFKANHQFSTLASMGIPPEHYLGVPRLWAVILAFPPLLMLSNLVCGGGSYLGFWTHTGRPVYEFYIEIMNQLAAWHFFLLCCKCVLASICVAFFSLYSGWQTRPDGLLNAPIAVVRSAMGESLFFSILSTVAVTLAYA